MILEYKCNELSTSISSDLASEFPVYIYWSADKQVFLYSTSVTELFDDKRIPKPLKESNEGISFLLQSGVVPPPKTSYQNIYILGIGDTAKIATVNGKIEVIFEHKFPFKPNADLILQMLAEATINRIDKSKPSFLFHSSGKDSNSIALALAEAGWQDKVTLITHKSKGMADESKISEKIAKQLGVTIDGIWVRAGLQFTPMPSQQAIDEVEFVLYRLLIGTKNQKILHKSARIKTENTANILMNSKAFREKAL